MAEPTVIKHLDDNSHIFYGDATGPANTYAVTLDPVPNELKQGLPVCVKIPVASTGSSTLNVNGLGARTLRKADGSLLTNLKAGGIYTFRYNVSNSSFIVQGEGGDIPVTGSQTFTTPGTHTFVVPPGISSVLAEIWGAGGGGSGAGGSYRSAGGEAGQYLPGFGGGGGGYAASVIYVVPEQVLTITVGAGGAGGAGGGPGKAGLIGTAGGSSKISPPNLEATGGQSRANNGVITPAPGGGVPATYNTTIKTSTGGNGHASSDSAGAGYGGGGAGSSGGNGQSAGNHQTPGAGGPIMQVSGKFATLGGMGGKGADRPPGPNGTIANGYTGDPGVQPGGGGGGASPARYWNDNENASGGTGGKGADGMVILSW